MSLETLANYLFMATASPSGGPFKNRKATLSSDRHSPCQSTLLRKHNTAGFQLSLISSQALPVHGTTFLAKHGSLMLFLPFSHGPLTMGPSRSLSTRAGPKDSHREEHRATLRLSQMCSQPSCGLETCTNREEMLFQ
jgi:hypothetical protein